MQRVRISIDQKFDQNTSFSIILKTKSFFKEKCELKKATSGIFLKLGQRTERMLNHFFQHVGRGCAEHPITILVPGILVTTALSCGIVFLKVTTDPVELWASPTSRSRMEKDFFDENFAPFYRTEQIIITAKNLPTIPYANETFGPILNKRFIYAMLDLQERIINEVVGEKGEKLSDVCFKPLAPDNTNCSVFSYLEYWQSNARNIEKTATSNKNITFNYLDHFLYCTRNPSAIVDATELQLSCQPRYGGIVDPAVALGGFMKPGKFASLLNSLSFLLHVDLKLVSSSV